jgi:uncharacterized protein involved in tolerance to divalent cations
VVTTVASREEAHRLARALVERKLAACAQISAIESLYRWKDEIQQEPEFRILFKTSVTSWSRARSAIFIPTSYRPSTPSPSSMSFAPTRRGSRRTPVTDLAHDLSS